jgi:hypothetical protein
MRSKGRPRVGQIQLKNGFYIEVCTKGSTKGVKIWSGTQQSMEEAAVVYSKGKDVLILGEYRDGIPVVAEKAVSRTTKIKL